MRHPRALPPHALASALCIAAVASNASAVDVSRPQPLLVDEGPILIDDRVPGAPKPAPAPVDVGQDLPADLPNKPVAPSGARAEEIAKLVRQLGAQDFRVRDAAAARLRDIGNDALSQLSEARGDPDPEVASRAAGIILRLTHHASLFARAGQTGRNGGVAGQRVRMSVGPNGVQTEVFEGNQRVEITETAGQITVSVTGVLEGRSVTERVSAASAAELKTKNPDAYAMYERWGSNGRRAAILRLNGGMPMRVPPPPPGVPEPFIVRGGQNVQIQVGGGVVAVPVAPVAAADDLAGLRRDTLKRMFQQDVAPERRADVLRKFDELSILQAAGEVGEDDAARLRRMQAYNDKCDELRKLMADLKLPDPGPALPPPAQARLGITIESEGPDGVVVGKVLDGSRGARAGLRSGDRIRSVNGKPLTSAVDLRKLVIGPDKMSFTVIRDGANKVLEEKSAEKK